MAAAELVSESDFAAGRWLLEAAGSAIRPAYWLHDSEAGKWRLMVEGRDADLGSSIDAILLAARKIKRPERRRAVEALLMGPVRISASPEPLAELFRDAWLDEAGSVERERVHGETFGRFFVDDAVLYRLDPPKRRAAS